MTTRALITAGDSGVGLAVARRLVDDGAEIVIASRHPDRAAGIAETIPGASAVEIDVTDEASVAAAFAQLDRVDVLVNAAGAHSYAPIGDLTLDEFERVVRPSIVGTFLVCRQAAPLLPDGGRIVNLSSLSMRGGTGLAHYASAKAAVVGLTMALATELLPRGIRVNAVAPSLLDTPMSRRSLGEEGLAAAAARTPTGRLVTVEQVAEAVAFLASTHSGGITGQCLVVDAGFSLPR